MSKESTERNKRKQQSSVKKVELSKEIVTTVNHDENKNTSTTVKLNTEEEESKEETGVLPSSNGNHDDTIQRKVVVYNVFKFSSNKEMTVLCNSWVKDTSIVISKVRKPPNVNFVILTLQSNDMTQPFIELINSNGAATAGKKKQYNGKPLFAKRCENDDDDATNQSNKREATSEDDPSNSNKRVRRDNGENKQPKTPDEVRDAITPLWKVPYKTQLQMKTKDMIKKCAMKIHAEIKAIFRNRDKEVKRNANVTAVPLYDWLAGKSSIKVSNIVPSPFVYEYRNKVEFTFGYYNNNKDVPAVGYLSSGWAGGVSMPHDLQNTPSEACGIAEIINDFLKDCPLTPYAPQTHAGTWRLVTIRISRRTKQCMVIIQHAPAVGDNVNILESEILRLVGMLTSKPIPIPQEIYPRKQQKHTTTTTTTTPGDNGMDDTITIGNADEEEEEVPSVEDVGEDDTDKEELSSMEDVVNDMLVTSIYFQEYAGLSMPPPAHPVQHRYGTKVIEERLGKCMFQISPGAFFQVNTAGAEILFQLVMDEFKKTIAKKRDDDDDSAPTNTNTLLFDVCCGTGTIGLTCMKDGFVKNLVGVDISEPAIEDAKVNAEKNGFVGTTNTRFVASRAETVLAAEIKASIMQKTTTTTIAVVDPAREGLHNDVLRTLRMNEQIQRLVYVSCNPTGSLVRDAAMLCAPPTKRYPGLPFKVTCAQPVDMFPLTPHCEMVMTFDRMTTEESGGGTMGWKTHTHTTTRGEK